LNEYHIDKTTNICPMSGALGK